jgi:hypothetical protein
MVWSGNPVWLSPIWIPFSAMRWPNQKDHCDSIDFPLVYMLSLLGLVSLHRWSYQ